MNSENSPAPDPTVNSPINPNPSPDPQTPPPKNKRTKLFVIIGAAAVVAAIILFSLIGYMLVRNSSDDASSKGPQVKELQNWLKPNSEIKVGGERYVSPCQALPKQTVEAAFGTLTERTVIQEDYLDQTVSAREREQRLACRYNPATNAKALEVGLETEQYPNEGDIKRLSSSLSIFREDKVQAEIDLYKKALASNDNKQAKDFLAKLERSFNTYKKYSNVYDPRELETVDTKGLIVPVSDTLSGAMGDFAVTGVAGNTVYTIYHTPKESKGRNGIKGYSSKELVAELLRMKKASEAVTKNIMNSSLDQSPTPTILGGNSNKYGSTKILEPCAILTADMFARINGGKQQNNPVKRTTVSNNFTKKSYTTRDKTLILPKNSCQRHAYQEDIETNTYGWLDMQYGSSTKQAEEWLADNYKVNGNDQLLQTDADWTLAFEDFGRPGEFLYTFRVGPYIATVTLYSRSDNSEAADASRDQYIQAINTLTAAIKDAAKKAE